VSWVDLSVGNVLVLMQLTGDLIAPQIFGCGSVSWYPAPGQPIVLVYTVPVSGPGSSGSLVLLCPYASGAAARIDVVAPAASFPDIHTYPTRLPHGPGGHHIGPPFAAGNDWEFANTAAVPHTITPIIDVLAPGGSVPLASTAAALVVPANSVARTTLPLAGLPAGPYTVRVQWFDPGLGATTTVSHGIEVSSGFSSVDLYFPGGKRIPVGGSTPASFTMQGSGSTTWSYLFCVGVLPGSTQLPDGHLVPLVPDPLVAACLQDGVGGLVSGYAGSTTVQFTWCAHGIQPWAIGAGVSIAHPNGPGVSGLTAHAAVVGFDPATQAWAASQPEELTLQ
jgi:hypothetical protein